MHDKLDRVGDQIAIPAVFMRGGVSKGLIFHACDLPGEAALRDRLFLSVLGSPDPNGRQLDGMGGGSSSLSKVCVVGPSEHPDADVDYTFAKVDVHEASVFYELACGSMASTIGPFAVDEGLVGAPPDGEVTVRIRDVNTNRMIHARFAMRGGKAAVAGDFAVDGVAGTGAPVRLRFLDPGGAATGRLLPTGRAVDRATGAGAAPVEFSCVDASNPIVFVGAEALGLRGTETPEEMERLPEMQARVSGIRRQIAGALGDISKTIGDAMALPRIAMVSAPAPYKARDGRIIGAGDVDIVVRMMAGNLPHGGLPLTTALCLGAACRIAGTIPDRLSRSRDAAAGMVRLGHPNGVWSVWARGDDRTGDLSIDAIETEMTQRRLFEGRVFASIASLSAGT